MIKDKDFKLYNSNWIYIILFSIVFLLTLIRQNSNTNFNCEICSDKAGYYMYMPAVFHYGFYADKYPENIDQKKAFYFDKETNKIVTKFTCGIAILQSPFYFSGYLIEKIFSLDVEPYSDYYMIFINIGAAFYLVLGLFFLRKWLNYYVSKKHSFWIILIIFFGTNLYYYTLDESLMSHLYSFSLFSMILYALKAFVNTEKFKYFLLFIIPLSFAILIRPTNALFAVFALFTDVGRFKDLIEKLKIIIKPKIIISSIVIFLLIILPQLIYWKFAYGSFVVWSYSGEGFIYWDNPKLLIVLFSPRSGVFPYTPIILLALFYSVIMIIKKEKNGVLSLLTFAIVSYMCASWHNVEFGCCNFGKRPMVEYLPLIMFPLVHLFNKFNTYRIWLKYLIVFSLFILVYYNLILFSAFNTGFFGDYWEWDKFAALIKKGFLFQ